MGFKGHPMQDQKISDQRDKILQVLDFAVHPNTGDVEALNAIRAYRRIVDGQPFSIIAGMIYGDGSPEDMWQDVFSQQELEINRLRGENRRLKKLLDESKRRRARQTGDAEAPMRKPREKTSVPEFTLTEAEWEIVESIIPARVLTDKARPKIAVAIIVTRTGCAWRDVGKNWTSFYNPWNYGNSGWRHQEWWKILMEALDVSGKPDQVAVDMAEE